MRNGGLYSEPYYAPINGLSKDGGGGLGNPGRSVMSGVSSLKIARIHLSKFLHPRRAEQKVRGIVFFFLSKNVVFYAHQCSVFKVLQHEVFFLQI